MSVLAFNVLSLLMSAIGTKHARQIEDEKIQLSPYYVAVEIRAHYAGLMIASDADTWRRYEQMSTRELSQALLRLAANVNPRSLRSHPRKLKEVPKKGYVPRAEAQKHVSTCQVLEDGVIA